MFCATGILARVRSPYGTLAIALLVFASALAVSQSPASIPDRLVIRAELQHAVDTTKAKTGDRVEMRAIAEERDGERILIAKNAKLVGRVLLAIPRKGSESDSRLQVVIERAEWKGHSVPLRAYIVAQGQAVKSEVYPCDYFSPPVTSSNDLGKSGYQICAEKGDAMYRRDASPMLKGVELAYVHGRKGPTILFSKVHNIVLPEGLVVLIRHSASPE